MALVATSSLPAFATMRQEGVAVVAPEQATASKLPRVSVGLLNLMPDAALRATDRQFIRLVAFAASEFDVWVHPFTVAEDHRSAAARSHVADHYESFSDVADNGLDALIVTGANPANHHLEREVFWSGLSEVLDWAASSTKSILCSCLATHAVVQKFRGVRRTKLPEKRWGVYTHHVVKQHPLLADLAGTVDAPHSHWYDMTSEDFETLGLSVILESEEAGVHMAVSEEDFYVFFQGHPEYDEVSLLKEYKREVGRFYRGERPDYPPFPDHYFDDAAISRLTEYRWRLEQAMKEETQPSPFPDEDSLGRHSNTWTEAGQIIYRNWLEMIAQRPSGPTGETP